MCKRVMIGLFAMSVVAIWWTEADAATCQQWGYSGGSRVCTKWSTKGVMVGVDFDGYACGSGELCKATANAAAEPNNSFAFCRNKLTKEMRKRTLPVSLIFSGSDGCVPGIDVCTATLVLNRLTSCQAACTPDEVCMDATPKDMSASVVACIGMGLTDCIELKEHCTIDPNNIDFNKVKPYQCEQQ